MLSEYEQRVLDALRSAGLIPPSWTARPTRIGGTFLRSGDECHGYIHEYKADDGTKKLMISIEVPQPPLSPTAQALRELKA